MLEDIDLNAIHDENARVLIQRLLNLIEELVAGQREAQAEIQRLRDAVNRLKGEQGKPQVKANQPQPAPTPPPSQKRRAAHQKKPGR